MSAGKNPISLAPADAASLLPGADSGRDWSQIEFRSTIGRSTTLPACTACAGPLSVETTTVRRASCRATSAPSAFLKSGNVEQARHAHRDRHVVNRTARRELVEKPDSLLRERQRPRPFPLPENNRLRLWRSRIAGSCARHTCRHGFHFRLHQRTHIGGGTTNSTGLLHRRDKTYGQRNQPAKTEIVAPLQLGRLQK